MGIRVVECGPFGCTLERGVVGSLDEIPEGYRVVRVLAGDEVTVYVDPVRGEENRLVA
jgi:hypothetical protein